MILAKDWCRLSETKAVSVMWNLTVLVNSNISRWFSRSNALPSVIDFLIDDKNFCD
jgi:hypothetical protein